jgi:hypothetical protein
MRRILLLCLLVLSVVRITHAQLPTPKAKMPDDTGKVYLRWSPLGLIDIMDGNVMVGGEYRFSKTWAATLDAGYIFYSQYVGGMHGVTGILLRPGARWYSGDRNDLFIELQFQYKEVIYKVQDWLDRDLIDGVSSYQQYTTFRYRKVVLGGHITAGGKAFLTRDHRLFIEIYAGVGLHFRKQGPYKEPHSAYDFNPMVATARTPSTVVKTVWPALPVGMRLGIQL